MPKYLALFSYAPDAMAAMIENPADRETAVRSVLDSVGGSLESMYWMFGSHDGIAIVDAPDSLTMAGISAAISSTGSISSETHELFTADEVHRILATARQARDHFAAARRIRVARSSAVPGGLAAGVAHLADLTDEGVEVTALVGSAPPTGRATDQREHPAGEVALHAPPGPSGPESGSSCLLAWVPPGDRSPPRCVLQRIPEPPRSRGLRSVASGFR